MAIYYGLQPRRPAETRSSHSYGYIVMARSRGPAETRYIVMAICYGPASRTCGDSLYSYGYMLWPGLEDLQRLVRPDDNYALARTVSVVLAGARIFAVMAYVVMAYTFMACIVMACIVMACIVMACIVMAYIVMAGAGGCGWSGFSTLWPT